MTDTLGVAVNRDGLHTLAVPDSFEADGPFVVELENYGEGTHVHLNLDDRLSEVARIRATNHYVEADESRPVSIEVRDSSEWPADTVRGQLKVVVAHGQETHYVDVTFDRTPDKQPVEVDPELSRPQADEPSNDRSLLAALPVVVLGGVALILAVGALFAGGGINFLLGAFAILAGAICAVAAYYLLS